MRLPSGIERRGGAFRVRLRRAGQAVSATFPTLVEAESFRASWIATVRKGEAPPAPPSAGPPMVDPAPLALIDACKDFVIGARAGVVRDRSGRVYRASTLMSYEERLRLHVLPYVGALPVAGIRRGTLRAWVEELSVDRSPATARIAFDALRPVMRRLVDLDVIESNPCSGIRTPAPDHRPARFLEVAEADRLREQATADRDPFIAPFVSLALSTGARRGELWALRWGREGLDLDERRILICRSYNPVTAEEGPTKNGRARTVPLGAELAAVLRRFRLAVGRPADGARVFPKDPRPAWERVRSRTELDDPLPTIRTMRHTAATWWLTAGLSVHAVAELLGHADPTLVIKRYGHALPSERSTAGDRLEAWVSAVRIAPGLPHAGQTI